jgi:CheY-like chemotaxis protein
MLDRKRLSQINNVDLGMDADLMTVEYLNDYEKTAGQYIDKFPAYEKDLKDSLAAGEFGYFIRVVGEIQEFMDKLYARNLSQSCADLTENVKNNEKAINDAALTLFLTGLSMLSIDLQMLLHNPVPEEKPGEKINVKLEDKKPEPPKKRAPSTNAEPTILVVDDIPLILNNLKMMLADTKYKFIGVPNANTALKYLQENTPDLILMDIEMPGMKGYELAERIKASGIDVPIIFLTGNTRRENVIKAIQAGAVDFIVKPMNIRNVLDRIDKHMGN